MSVSKPPEIDRTPGESRELLYRAAHLMRVTQFGSVSLLQRKLHIGFAKALRVMDRLEELGVVGPYREARARDVLIAPGQPLPDAIIRIGGAE